ncbi:sulfatase [Thalassoglobus sp. JC818]|uniref:sulfatase n=1 Tax=Thalassoglobus sp. JC818 TaxID=3232136 RepID=UPI00345856C2
MFRILSIPLLFLALLPNLSAEDAAKNVLLICVDDLRPELKCFGVDYIHSPNIDQLAKNGRAFHRHYVQAPTCGASRYTLLTGQYGGAGNNAIFDRAKKLLSKPETVSPSMPAWFRQHGYTTVSVGKVSHHPGGRGGPDWNDDDQPEMPNSWDRHLLPAGEWQHPRGWMHGLAHGEIRRNAKEMDVFQAEEGPDSIYPDGISIETALEQIDQLTKEAKSFFLAVGILRPHLPFGAPKQYLTHYSDATFPEIPHPSRPNGKTTWHGSGEFMKYNRWGQDPNSDADFALAVRQHYAACVSYADAQVGKLIQKLNQSGTADETVIVLWGDHGWHLGEHAVWGKHTLFEESLRSPLIISYKDMPHPGASTKAIVESIDLFPTLCDLTGIEMPNDVDGVTLRPWLTSPEKDGHPAISYFRNARTVRTDDYRLIAHSSGESELYDENSEAGETQNIANQHPEAVERLNRILDDRLGR